MQSRVEVELDRRSWRSTYSEGLESSWHWSRLAARLIRFPKCGQSQLLVATPPPPCQCLRAGWRPSRWPLLRPSAHSIARWQEDTQREEDRAVGARTFRLLSAVRRVTGAAPAHRPVVRVLACTTRTRLLFRSGSRPRARVRILRSIGCRMIRVVARAGLCGRTVVLQRPRARLVRIRVLLCCWSLWRRLQLRFAHEFVVWGNCTLISRGRGHGVVRRARLCKCSNLVQIFTLMSDALQVRSNYTKIWKMYKLLFAHVWEN